MQILLLSSDKWTAASFLNYFSLWHTCSNSLFLARYQDMYIQLISKAPLTTPWLRSFLNYANLSLKGWTHSQMCFYFFNIHFEIVSSWRYFSRPTIMWLIFSSHVLFCWSQWTNAKGSLICDRYPTFFSYKTDSIK